MEPKAIYELFQEIQKTDITLDKWQSDVMQHEGSITIRAGRQVGKSEVVGRKTTQFALKYPGAKILIIAPAQRQSSHLFSKIKQHLGKVSEKLLAAAGGFQKNPKHSARQVLQERRLFEIQNGIYKETPTKTNIILCNGTEIYCLPAGKTGDYLRCFTLDLIIADEAAYIPEAVWRAIKPMIAVSKQRGLGWTILLSTPFGKGGYFFESFHDEEFRQFHVSSELCRRIPRDFLQKEKERMSKLEYTQEYLGEFVDEFNQFFPTALIKQRMTFIEWERVKNYDKYKNYYLGVDIARYGEDENAFVVAEIDNNQFLRIVHVATTQRKSLVDTTGRILDYIEKYQIRKTFIDDAGVGGGVFDMLVEKLGKNKVIPLNNAKKTQEKDGRTGTLFKEDLYSHAAALMEKEPAQIEIISDLKLLKSLKSMTFEYTTEKNLRIFGVYSHLAEAFVRAVWCKKAKGLNLFIV